MRITCPQCHSHCRLKNDAETSDSSQGKCPECGHIFLLPPGISREPSAEDRISKQKKAGFKTDSEYPDKTDPLKPLQESGKASFLWLISGFCLIVLLALIFILPQKSSSPATKKQTTASAPPITTEQPAKLGISPEASRKAIAQIKHHTLVGDADISIADNQLQLALLVAGNTPVAYAERLGRQFAHYLKEQLPTTQTQEQKPVIKISVYYPSGTRIAVATNNQSGEEEVLPKIIETKQ